MLMIIDADSHWAPPAEIFEKILPEKFYLEYLHDNKDYFRSFEQYRQEAFAKLKINRQLLNFYGPTVGLQYSVFPLRANGMAVCYNQHMQYICDQYSEFDYTAWLPMQDIEFCHSLLEQSFIQRSFAVHVGEQVPWGFLPQYKQIFEKLARLKIPVYLHFSGHNDLPTHWLTSCDHRHDTFLSTWPPKANAGVGENPTWKTTLASFILSGLLEQTDLRIVVAEQGLEWLPEFCQVMKTKTGVDPIPYFKKYFWFTTEPEQENFLPLADQLGFDRLLFATDWPHGTSDIGGTNMFSDVDLLEHMLNSQQISQKNYQAITHKNYLLLKDRV